VTDGEAENTNRPVPVAPVEVTPSIVWWPVKVLAASVLAMVAEVAGKVITVESVPEKVMLLFAVRVLPLAMVRVPVVEVTISPFTEVAIAAPKLGVMRVGLVAITMAPEPVGAPPGSCPAATLPDMSEKDWGMVHVVASPLQIVIDIKVPHILCAARKP
jgi:hypothetical protein